MPGFRFSPLNRVRCVTTSTGTGDMVIGSTSPGYQSFLNLDDGAVVPYWAQYGSQWECGLATKSGGSLERTTILESTNGNSAVEWADGTTKNIAIDWLANNVVDCVDESISVVDDILTGKTLISGLSIGAVVTWFKTFALEGVDISITYNGTTSGTFANLRKIHVDQDTPGTGLPGPFDLTLDFAADVGSSHIVTIESHRLLHFENISQGQDVIVHLKYEAFEDHKHKVTWPSDLDEPECEIEWVNGYNPAFSPVVGCSDTFKFERIDDGEGIPKYLGWILSRERPVIVDGSATGGVVVTMSTVTNGAAKGPNAQQWLSITVDSDSMRYTLNRTGTVNGGTFDLTIGLAPNQNFTIENIPYDVTAYDLLLLIWDQTSLTPGDVNVDGGLLGADSLDKLTDSPGSIHLEFIGKSRYAGYVISVDDTNLTGGGSYDTEAVGQGSGSQAWPFTNNSTNAGPIVFTFNGYQTGNLAINSSDAQIKTALESLNGIGTGNIKVTSYGLGVYCFEFIGDLRATHIIHEIQFVPGYWPKSNLGEPTGQRHSTAMKGDGPLGSNEVQRLTITSSPIQGYVVLTILGHDVSIPVVSTLAEVQTLLDTALGSGVVVASGGPLPEDVINIEFIGDEGYQNQPLCSVSGLAAGSEDIDWSICNGKRITLRPSNGTVLLNHVNVIEGETIHVTLKNSPTSIPATVETIQNGSGSLDEIHRLTITDSTPGDVIVEILGKTVTIPRTSTNAAVRALILSATGADVTITGGPINSAFINIIFDVAPFRRTNLSNSLIMYASSGPIQWGGVPVDWGSFDPPEVPLSGGSIYLEFYGETTELILGKKWHHVESSGGGDGGVLADQLLPGISIEITHDVLADTFEFDNLERREIIDDGATIICDGVADKGVDKEVTVTADRDIDANNFKLGETLRLKITQGTTGNWKVNYLFDIEWQEGFEPVLTTVPGKSDCFEMRCIRERNPYQVPAFKAWVETTERPQPIEFVSNPAALNEIQEVSSDTVPTGGVWVLTYQGIPTSAIPYNATHSAIQTILETHPYIGSGNVEVSGGLLGVNSIRIEFVGSLAHQNLSEMSLQFGGLLF